MDNKSSFKKSSGLARPLELVVDNELMLIQFSLKNVNNIFSLIQENKSHLSKYYSSTVQEYSTSEDVRNMILYPKDSSALHLGIWANNIYVGSVNITPSIDPTSVDIGYYLGKKFEGRGYATRSVNRLVNYCFEELGLLNVRAVVHPDNIRSIKVLESCEFIKAFDIGFSSTDHSNLNYFKTNISNPRKDLLDYSQVLKNLQ
ncbi:MAG: GNAT family N-acetyltransferase [Candidatus Woesearchaeota archaeon]